ELVHLKDEPMKMAKIESAVRIVLDFYRAFNQHDADEMIKLISEDCTFEHASPAPDGSLYCGKENLYAFWQDVFQNTITPQIEIEDIFGLGLHCVARWKIKWVDSTGQQNHQRGIHLFLVKNSLICSIQAYVKH
ncbi:MAG: nuclear transport factor 2 family protein, partial [Anaerolineales bacterium]